MTDHLTDYSALIDEVLIEQREARAHGDHELAQRLFEHVRDLRRMERDKPTRR
jgi:ribosome-binding protein aMBF1 (putative translation factor)